MGNGSGGVVGLHNWAGSWDSDLVLNGLALLVRDPLGDHLAVNLLNVLASGDRLLCGSLLWGVGADLLGHLTAVRLDSHLAGGLGNSLNLDCWSSMDGSTIASYRFLHHEQFQLHIHHSHGWPQPPSYEHHSPVSLMGRSPWKWCLCSSSHR